MTRSPMDSGRELCEALGLDANRVTSIVLRWTASDVPRVRVTLVDLDGTDIVRTIGRYRLEPISWSVPVRSTTADGTAPLGTTTTDGTAR